jgi:hypothetical protein
LKGLRKQFFSEEKNQKTFAFDAIPDVSDMARTFVQAQEPKSFGSFLQKRTLLLLVRHRQGCARGDSGVRVRRWRSPPASRYKGSP